LDLRGFGVTGSGLARVYCVGIVFWLDILSPSMVGFDTLS
jgi:hypothetical protein